MFDEGFLDYCKRYAPRLVTALKGGASEHKMYKYLSERYETICSPDNGEADFKIITDGKALKVEHKRARNTSYANGDLRVELQKSRDSGGDKKNRFYRKDQFDIISVDVSEHTGNTNDFRFALPGDLTEDSRYPDCLKKMQRIKVDDFGVWKKDINILT